MGSKDRALLSSMPAQDAPAGERQCAVKCHTAVAVPHIEYDLSDVFSFYVIFEITKLLKVIFSGCQAFRLYFVLTSFCAQYRA